jgi:hypothetical protein
MALVAIGFIPLRPIHAQSTIDTAAFMATEKYCELRAAGFDHTASWNDAVLAQERSSIYRLELTANKERSNYFGRRTEERILKSCPQYWPGASTGGSQVMQRSPSPSKASCGNFIIASGKKECI